MISLRHQYERRSRDRPELDIAGWTSGCSSTDARGRSCAWLELALAGALAAVLLAAALATSAAVARGETPGAGETPTSPTATPTSPTTTTTAPGPEAPAGVHGQVGEPATTEAPPAPNEGSTTTETTPTPAPEVKAQAPQAESAPRGSPNQGSPSRHGHSHGRSGSKGAKKKSAPTAPGLSGKRSALPAPPPSALTPPLPGALGAPISGVPDFFIESFRIPPFLLPIYQAAGTAYEIPWEILAAINEVETDYGRDLSVSSAGAEGWMQFLPSSWATYGVDANGDGYEDPYNPADAIFAAARYLQAAGGSQHIRAAIYAYNHSDAYVESVLLRAQLLNGTPPELLSAITGLTESRFPVHAPAHFSDGFPSPHLAGTVIYSQAGAPVIAVQDGQVTAIGDSPALGRYVSLRDVYGNTYTYAELGSVAALYPVLEPRVHTAPGARNARTGGGSSGPGGGVGEPAPRPSAPASAGVQPRSPLSEGALSSSLAMGAAASLESPPPPAGGRAAMPSSALPTARAAGRSTPRTFRAGSEQVYLHPLRPGVQVLAGTILGHIGAAATGPEPHMLFQIRPAGAGAPLIDPKPILDGWVRLEETSVFRARGQNPFLGTSPSVGQVLLASKPQLEQLVLRDPAVHLPACERGEVRAGELDRRVLGALEFLSVSGLRPTVSPRGCAHGSRGAGGGRNLAGGAAGETLDISAIDGTPIAGHEGAGSVADIAVRRLLRLQGTMKPAEIVSAESYPGSDNTLTLPGYRGVIHLQFASTHPLRTRAGLAHAATLGSPLSPSQWLQLVARLGEIPDPAVAEKPSAAAIPDPSREGG